MVEENAVGSRGELILLCNSNGSGSEGKDSLTGRAVCRVQSCCALMFGQWPAYAVGCLHCCVHAVLQAPEHAKARADAAFERHFAPGLGYN